MYTRREEKRNSCVYIHVPHVILQNMHRETMRLSITEKISTTPCKHSLDKLRQKFNKITE